MNKQGNESSVGLVNSELEETQHRDPDDPVYFPGSEVVPEFAQTENEEELPPLMVPDTANEEKKRDPIIRLPDVSLNHRFIAKQMYEGTVQEIRIEEFTATLRDQLDPSTPRQSATIALDHVWEDDLGLVVPGAVFYWSIGYRIERHGQRYLQSNIRFRRLPVWTKSELKKLAQNAEEFNDFFTQD